MQFGFMLALLPGVVAIVHTGLKYRKPARERQPRAFVLPADLADEHAWVWSEDLSGTIWYYVRKPAFKINFTDPITRRKLLEFVNRRGEPQFLIDDGSDMHAIGDEIRGWGGTLETRGVIDDHSYFLIRWPKAQAVAPQSSSATSR